jgi:radical SAM protein with 4Fe4S-binding SPASM domain
MYVKQNGDVYPCCQSYMLDGAPLGNVGEQPLAEIWNSAPCRRCAAARRRPGGEVDICSRCCTTIPHPALVAGSLVFMARRCGV